MSTKPGRAYMPVASISWSASRGARSAFSGRPGQPACSTSVILSPSMTMSTGPRGGAPVPSMRVTPRMTSLR